MKKTTWAIIGLSVCVVALSIALVIVITQKKTETIIATESDLSMYEPNNIMLVTYPPKPWQPSSSFSIGSDYTKTKSSYYCYGTNGMVYTIPESELDKRGDFLGTSLPNLQGKMSIAKRPYQTKKEEKK